MNVEKVQDIICDLWYLIENAQGITAALYELTLCDELMNTEDMNTHNTERMLKVWELLRLHDASSSLVCVLRDTLQSIHKAIEAIDAAAVEKPDGIQTAQSQRPNCSGNSGQSVPTEGAAPRTARAMTEEERAAMIADICRKYEQLDNKNKEHFRIAVYAAHDKEEREQQAKDGERE